MHHKKYLWGLFLLVLGLVFAVPHSVQAQPPLDSSGNNAAKFINKDAGSRPFLLSDVWALTRKHQRTYKSHFTTELLTCLMWEESGFRLIRNSRSGAAGFGQILPSTLAEVNEKFGTNLTPADLLNSPDSSVKATVLTLELMWDWKQDKEKALLAYAGGVRNYRYVRKWLNAEPHMIAARFTPFTTRDMTTAHLSDEFIDAMHLCSQPGFHPDTIAD